MSSHSTGRHSAKSTTMGLTDDPLGNRMSSLEPELATACWELSHALRTPILLSTGTTVKQVPTLPCKVLGARTPPQHSCEHSCCHTPPQCGGAIAHPLAYSHLCTRVHVIPHPIGTSSTRQSVLSTYMYTNASNLMPGRRHRYTLCNVIHDWHLSDWRGTPTYMQHYSISYHALSSSCPTWEDWYH